MIILKAILFRKLVHQAPVSSPLLLRFLNVCRFCYVNCKAHLHVKSYQMHAHYVTGYQVNTVYLTIQNAIRASLRIINNN